MGIQSLLYHGFGIKDQEYLKTTYAGGDIFFHIRTKSDKLRCGECGSANVIHKGKQIRKFKTLNIGLKPVFLIAEVHRLQCKDCGCLKQEKLSYVDEKKVTPVPLSAMP
jgi:transposase